jgi:hypothetical protein
MRINRRIIAAIGVVLVAGTLAACSNAPVGTTASGLQQESQAQTQDSNNLDHNQPVPVYKFSQARQTVINVQDIEATGANTTSFGLSNNGSEVWHCSSIGMPVPADAQLTNPQQIVPHQYTDANGNLFAGDGVIAQPDPIGYYTGVTTGTNTLCVTPTGAQYIQYWEGYVDAVSGPASFVNGQVVLQGAPVPLKAGK